MKRTFLKPRASCKYQVLNKGVFIERVLVLQLLLCVHHSFVFSITWGRLYLLPARASHHLPAVPAVTGELKKEQNKQALLCSVTSLL